MLRREETLDRSIDRKVKILLSLRKELANGQPQEPQTSESTSAPPAPADGDNNADMAHISETLEAQVSRHSREACPPAEAGGENPLEGPHSRPGGNPSSCELAWNRAYAGLELLHF